MHYWRVSWLPYLYGWTKCLPVADATVASFSRRVQRNFGVGFELALNTNGYSEWLQIRKKPGRGGQCLARDLISCILCSGLSVTMVSSFEQTWKSLKTIIIIKIHWIYINPIVASIES